MKVAKGQGASFEMGGTFKRTCTGHTENMDVRNFVRNVLIWSQIGRDVLNCAENSAEGMRSKEI